MFAHNCLMALWNKQLLAVSASKVLVLQWNKHPCFLIYVHSKSKLIQKISCLQEWHQNTRNGKSLFTWRYIHYKTFTLREKKQNKTAENYHIWLVVVLWKCFIRQPPVQDDYCRVVPKLSHTGLTVKECKVSHEFHCYRITV